jgi:hypothetical protein
LVGAIIMQPCVWKEDSFRHIAYKSCEMGI